MIAAKTDAAKAAAAVGGWYDTGGVVIDKATLIDWATRNKGSASLNVGSLRQYVDPEGLNLAKIMLLHNDDHWRVHVMVKSIDSDEPVDVTIDISMEDWDRARKGTASSLERLRRDAQREANPITPTSTPDEVRRHIEMEGI